MILVYSLWHSVHFQANEALKKLSAAPFDQFPPTVELLFFTLRKGDQGEERRENNTHADSFQASLETTCLPLSLSHSRKTSRKDLPLISVYRVLFIGTLQ